MTRSPRLATVLLRRLLPRDLRGETILGDLIQELEERAAEHGRLRLWLWFWMQALALGGHYMLLRTAKAVRRAAGALVPRHVGTHRNRHGGDPAFVEVRPLTREEAMENLWTDLRYGVRMLLRTPTLSIVSILTIGLGIGLVTFAFSAVYGAALRPMPVRDPERLVVVVGYAPETDDFGMWPMADIVEFRDQSTVFESLAAAYTGTVNLAGEDGPAERFDGAFVTADGLAMLGVPPYLGRTFQPGEDRPGVEGTVVLGYDVWRNRFGADESVIGRRVRANGETMTIIGVMPPGFRFPFDQEVWLAYREDWESQPRTAQWLQPYGYLREGVERAAATDEIEGVAARIAAEYPDTNEGIRARVTPFQENYMPAEITAVMWLMFGATLGVMLIACANVANLLLARAALRTREVAVRTALGANRFRVVRQLLTEALVLGVLGGGVGLVIAYFGTEYFNVAVANIEKPYWIDMRTDFPALLFTAVITLVAAVTAGTIPALRASGAAVGGVLRDESRGSTGLRIGRLTGLLVIGELAVSCALLIGAGFMVQSIINTRTMDLGFDPEGLMTARVGLFETDYPTRDSRQRFFRDLYERLNAQPGVRAAALTSNLPSTGASRPEFGIEGIAYETDSDYPRVNSAQISSGYFATVGAQLIAGREFRPAESFWSAQEGETEPVVIVNRSFVDRYLPDGDPLGRRLRLGTGTSQEPWLRIVGVVPDQYIGGGVGGIGNDRRPPEQIYLPIGQQDPRFLSMVLRAKGSADGLTDQARAAVSAIDPELPIYFVAPMSQVLDDSSWAVSLFGWQFTIFGAAALFLASVGLYGVVSFSVAQRRQEMGVRMALGAEARDILGVVFRRVALQLLIGLSIGVALAWAASGPLRFIMFGVETTDLRVYAVIVVALAATGLLATFFPASRATRVDPVTALRTD